ncbi:hypothetical protein NHQ30_009828 [Ciborinia camelliae]|nr:hypothetical protein NHQ30_009828 [Ciborinia camelliae]
MAMKLNGGAISLVESQDMPETEKCSPYITLSHCWVREQPLTTTRHNFADHKIEVPWTKLPRIFQDAIMVVRALEIIYLWIDSLCIIQQDQEDCEKESIRMASVYSNSYLNLAATGSSDSRGGMDDSLITPLLSRAWVFQERQLAPRTLHFHPTEMAMECKATLRCECTGLDKIFSNANKEPSDLNDLEDWEVFERWFDVVKEYAILSLSYANDRLVALSGIATVFQEHQKSAYLAGIWKNDLARGILWSVLQNKINREKKPTIFTRRLRVEPHFAPSWSWASPILELGDIIDFHATDDSTFRAH